MKTEQIQSIILSAMKTANISLEPDEQLEIGLEAPIFGPESKLDSLGLVSLLIDIEESFADEGVTIVLSDERAMSEKRTPYRDVPTLTAFIESQISKDS
jgi:acyl carrier protein